VVRAETNAHLGDQEIPMDQLLLLLPALACPIGMGAMMFFMAKKPKDQQGSGQADPREQEITAIRAEITELRRRQEHATRGAESL
jgi:hypothetical protein